MANYTVPAGDVGVHAKTLVANTADKVTFTSQDLPMVEVITDGSAAVFVSFGAVPATVNGTPCFQVPALAGASVFPVHTSGDTVVNLISAGTPVYSVAKAS